MRKLCIKNLSVCIVALFVSQTTYCQTEAIKFEKFAIAQDSLMKLAYKNLDTDTYKTLLVEFDLKFNALAKSSQQQMLPYYQGAYYNLACTFSLLGKKEQALASLQKSVDAGFSNYSTIETDDDLKNIRAEHRFFAILAQARSIGDYLFILKKAADFDNSDFRVLPSFIYQESNDPNLKSLRDGFKLDSVVGQGNDVSRIINLMHWIHNYIPHDGQHANPVAYNAEILIRTCKAQKRGLNCRGLATVLNECYLAMGYPSRLVICLPKDSLKIDPDCHVITTVFVKSLAKWIWMDPTNNAYVMDQNGNLLGIEEVRKALINDMQLILNPDANWNNKQSVTKDDYLYNYMAKNLYRFEVPVESKYDLENPNNKSIVYIDLSPLEYFDQKPDKTESLNSKNHCNYIRYKTNNEAQFWAVPSF